MIKRLYVYITGKSVKQRIYTSIALTAVLTLLFFTVKANFFDKREAPQTEIISESSELSESTDASEAETAPPASEPQFHISLIDIGVLLVVVAAYIVHKLHEKRKQRRL